ncbi:MAG: sulfatase-like hydrolase/transferase [Armatimonadota bacterium]
MFTRRQFLKTVGAGVAGMVALGNIPDLSFAGNRDKKLNFLFILADDLGWQDTSVYGSKFYETPNIDRLAKRGMMFTQAYAANPTCSPTRASIMTGLYPARLGMGQPSCHVPEVVLEKQLANNAPAKWKALPALDVTRLNHKYFTLAEAMKLNGYVTGHFGKWHLGHEPYDPLHQGFDVDIPHSPVPGPVGGYFGPWQFGNIKGDSGENIDDRMSDEVIKFMRENKDRPFFANYWCFSVHSPFDAKHDLVEKYKKKADPNNPQHNPLMGAMVEAMDSDIGRVLDELDNLGLTDNTAVIFFSDNGGVDFVDKVSFHNEPSDIPVTSNLPLRAGKGSIYEGGTREPCIVVWPGVTKPGSKSDEVISSIDWYPTMMDISRAKHKPEVTFDGMSIVPALKGRYLNREAIFCHLPFYVGFPPDIQLAKPSTYVRKGDWKLIRFYCDNDDQTDRFELYNLKNDVGETTNIAGSMPEKVMELNTLIDRFLKEMDAVVPKPNPDYRKAI